jgi:vacuolar-type H+-ATPase subunit I/STV1
MNTKSNRILEIKHFVKINNSLMLKILIVGIVIITCFIQTSAAREYSDPTKETLDEVTFDLMRKNPNVPITKDMVIEELQKRINQEQLAMAEDQKKLKATKNKLRSQLKNAMDKIIQSKDTKFMEEIIVKKYGVRQAEAKAMILSHDERAYEVLRDMIVNEVE